MNKRRDFLQRLLNERNEVSPEGRSDQVTGEIEMLRQMIDEIDKEWISYEYRPPRRYIGTVAEYGSHGKNLLCVGLETQQGILQFPVSGLSDQAARFLNDTYDMVRHQRYDYGINTDVVAEVDSSGYLKGLDWFRKWDINAPKTWTITDDESFQCRCVICEEDQVCEFVEILDLGEQTDSNAPR